MNSKKCHSNFQYLGCHFEEGFFLQQKLSFFAQCYLIYSSFEWLYLKNCASTFLLIQKKPFWDKKEYALTIFPKLAYFVHFNTTGKCEKFIKILPKKYEEIYLFSSAWCHKNQNFNFPHSSNRLPNEDLVSPFKFFLQF